MTDIRSTEYSILLSRGLRNPKRRPPEKTVSTTDILSVEWISSLLDKIPDPLAKLKEAAEYGFSTVLLGTFSSSTPESIADVVRNVCIPYTIRTGMEMKFGTRIPIVFVGFEGNVLLSGLSFLPSTSDSDLYASFQHSTFTG